MQEGGTAGAVLLEVKVRVAVEGAARVSDAKLEACLEPWESLLETGK